MIIDSKYYRYGVDNSDSLLPNTKAIYKQIVYGDYVKKKLKKEENIDYKIYNVFVIPSDHNEFIEYKGNAKMKLLDDSETQKTVHLCLINMNVVVDKFFNKECDELIQQLIEKIPGNA